MSLEKKTFKYQEVPMLSYLKFDLYEWTEKSYKKKINPCKVFFRHGWF